MQGESWRRPTARAPDPRRSDSRFSSIAQVVDARMSRPQRPASLRSGRGLPAVRSAPVLSEAQLTYRRGGKDGAGANTRPSADAATNPRLLDPNEHGPTGE